MSEVFISYARSASDQAQKIAVALRKLGYDVWRDDALPAHRSYAEVIAERLESAKAVVVVWSAEAVKSEWVQSEADHARLKHKLVQLSVDGATPPMPFDRIQCADLARWKGDPAAAGWRKVVDSVAELVGPPSSHEAPAPGGEVSGERKPPPGHRWPLALGAGALVLLIAAGVWWRLGRPSAPAAAPRVAVAPFDTPGGSREAVTFAAGLQDEILGALSTNQVETVSRSEGAALRGADSGSAVRRLGVGLLLEGSVEEANGSIQVRLHLDDPGRRTAIWSEAFNRPAAEADALQAEVAAKAVRITSQALEARAAGVTDPAVLSDFVTGDEHTRFDLSGGVEAAEPFHRRVIARAPRFAGGHAYLAMDEAFESTIPGNPRAAEQKADAEREAHEALRLDPKGYNAFLALSIIMRPTDWRGRDAILQKGETLDPTEASYPFFLGQDFAGEGRLREAAEMARRTVALNAFWPSPQMFLGLALMDIGQGNEGQQILDRMERVWPGVWATRDGRFTAASLDVDPDTATALATNPQTRPLSLDSRSAELWLRALRALKSGRPDERAAAAAIRAAAEAGQFFPGAAVTLLVQLGDIDGAFAVAERFPLQVEFGGNPELPPPLFIAQTAPLRRDPRFMPLAARLGLVDFWRASGAWPDFCSEPALPYDCKAEAARLASSAKP